MKAALLRNPQAVLAALIILVSMAVAPGRLPQVSVCPFRSATGLPCPGCGLTRAFCAIGHAEFAAAWAFNPFSFVLTFESEALRQKWIASKDHDRVWPEIEKTLADKNFGILLYDVY